MKICFPVNKDNGLESIGQSEKEALMEMTVAHTCAGHTDGCAHHEIKPMDPGPFGKIL